MTEPAPALFGVMGWPVEHSRSPSMHNAALAALGIHGSYVRIAVEPGQIPYAISRAIVEGLRGANVTLPHKEAAFAACEPDAIAREVGAVNTLRFEGGGVAGTNTDVHGVRMLLDEAGADASGRALILGKGGAARAVVVALLPTASSITVVSRTEGALSVAGASIEVAGWRALDEALARADLVIDATPRGLDDAAPPIDLAPLAPHAVVLDLVVRRETRLIADARARELRAHAGSAMLLHQGAAALEYWLGLPAPLAVMRAALERDLAR